MTREALFPDAHREGQDRRIAAAWDLSWPVPVPRFEPKCPGCGGVMVLKGWKFHTRSTGTSHPYRCDVRLKCVACSVVPVYGVVVPKAMFDAHGRRSRTRTANWIEWREGKRLLAEAGFFDKT